MFFVLLIARNNDLLNSNLGLLTPGSRCSSSLCNSGCYVYRMEIENPVWTPTRRSWWFCAVINYIRKEKYITLSFTVLLPSNCKVLSWGIGNWFGLRLSVNIDFSIFFLISEIVKEAWNQMITSNQTTKNPEKS